MIGGRTLLVVDCSGSMSGAFYRACECAERIAAASETAVLYCTGSHTAGPFDVPMLGTPDALWRVTRGQCGRRGLYTRDAMDWIRERERGVPTRIVLLTDEADCDDTANGPRVMPNPPAKPAPIVGLHVTDWRFETAGEAVDVARALQGVPECMTVAQYPELAPDAPPSAPRKAGPPPGHPFGLHNYVVRYGNASRGSALFTAVPEPWPSPETVLAFVRAREGRE